MAAGQTAACISSEEINGEVKQTVLWVFMTKKLKSCGYYSIVENLAFSSEYPKFSS